MNLGEESVAAEMEGLSPFEFAVIYSEEIILQIEGLQPEIVTVSDTSLSSTTLPPTIPSGFTALDEAWQQKKARSLDDLLSEHYNLRTIHSPNWDIVDSFDD